MTEKDKCDAFFCGCEMICHFAAAHQLTFNNQSSMQNEVQLVNALYENPAPILIFSPLLPVNFKDNQLQHPNHDHSDMFVSTADVQNIFKTRNSKKSSRNDSIPNYALKKLSLSTIYWLAVILAVI